MLKGEGLVHSCSYPITYIAVCSSHTKTSPHKVAAYIEPNSTVTHIKAEYSPYPHSRCHSPYTGLQGSYSSHTCIGLCKSPDCPLGNLIILWELSPSPRIARKCSWILCPGWVRTWPCQPPILGNKPSELVLTREWKEARLGWGVGGAVGRGRVGAEINVSSFLP